MNVLQLKNKEDSHLQQNKILSKFQKILQVIHFGDAVQEELGIMIS